MKALHFRITILAEVLSIHYNVEFETRFEGDATDTIVWTGGPSQDDVIALLHQEGLADDLELDLHRFDENLPSIEELAAQLGIDPVALAKIQEKMTR